MRVKQIVSIIFVIVLVCAMTSNAFAFTDDGSSQEYKWAEGISAVTGFDDNTYLICPSPVTSVINDSVLLEWLNRNMPLDSGSYSINVSANASNGLLGTGAIVNAIENDGTIQHSWHVVVSGDALGTGEMSVTQIEKVASTLRGRDMLSGAYLNAVDVTGNGRIDLADLVAVAKLYTTYLSTRPTEQPAIDFYYMAQAAYLLAIRIEQPEDDWIDWTENTPELVSNYGVVPAHTVQSIVDSLQDLYILRQGREMWGSESDGITGTNEFWNFAPAIEHAISTGELRPDEYFGSTLCFTEEAIVSLCRMLLGSNVTLGLHPDGSGYYIPSWGIDAPQGGFDEVYHTGPEPFDVSGTSNYEYELLSYSGDGSRWEISLQATPETSSSFGFNVTHVFVTVLNYWDSFPSTFDPSILEDEES